MHEVGLAYAITTYVAKACYNQHISVCRLLYRYVRLSMGKTVGVFMLHVLGYIMYYFARK